MPGICYRLMPATVAFDILPIRKAVFFRYLFNTC